MCFLGFSTAGILGVFASLDWSEVLASGNNTANEENLLSSLAATAVSKLAKHAKNQLPRTELEWNLWHTWDPAFCPLWRLSSTLYKVWMSFIKRFVHFRIEVPLEPTSQNVHFPISVFTSEERTTL